MRSESLWYERELPALTAQLSNGSGHEASAALQAITRHRWRRHDLAGELEPLLTHPDAVVRRLACAALGQLGSATSIAGLLECMASDPAPEVPREAWKALKKLTGLDLPQDPIAWKLQTG